MSWPSPPKLIRNSTPTMLIIAKIRPEAQADEDRRQRRGQQDLAELLRRREPEAAADVDQHLARAGEAFERLQDHRREAGGEADHHDRRRAAAEDHEEQRIHEHDRRGGERADPRLARRAQQPRSGRAARRAAMPTTASSRLAHSTSCVVCQKRCSTFSSAMMRGIAARICDGSGTMKRIDHAGADQHLDERDRGEHRRRRRTCARGEPRSGADAARHRSSPGAQRTRDSSSSMPRLASSRRSCQISAT